MNSFTYNCCSSCCVLNEKCPLPIHGFEHLAGVGGNAWLDRLWSLQKVEERLYWWPDHFLLPLCFTCIGNKRDQPAAFSCAMPSPPSFRNQKPQHSPSRKLPLLMVFSHSNRKGTKTESWMRKVGLMLRRTCVIFWSNVGDFGALDQKTGELLM